MQAMDESGQTSRAGYYTLPNSELPQRRFGWELQGGRVYSGRTFLTHLNLRECVLHPVAGVSLASAISTPSLATQLKSLSRCVTPEQPEFIEADDIW
jgi:hypothetical protein